jgi:hypothetical protein
MKQKRFFFDELSSQDDNDDNVDYTPEDGNDERYQGACGG